MVLQSHHRLFLDSGWMRLPALKILRHQIHLLMKASKIHQTQNHLNFSRELQLSQLLLRKPLQLPQAVLPIQILMKTMEIHLLTIAA